MQTLILRVAAFALLITPVLARGAEPPRAALLADEVEAARSRPFTPALRAGGWRLAGSGYFEHVSVERSPDETYWLLSVSPQYFFADRFSVGPILRFYRASVETGSRTRLGVAASYSLWDDSRWVPTLGAQACRGSTASGASYLEAGAEVALEGFLNAHVSLGPYVAYYHLFETDRLYAQGDFQVGVSFRLYY